MKRDHWSSKAGFVLAAAGSAVGLGNLWKFPYIAWDNGGGIFILIYLAAILLVGWPIMVSEIAIGKIAERDPVGAFRALGGADSPFRYVGILGIMSAFVILSYYSVIAGWGIQYTIHSAMERFDKAPIERVEKYMAGDQRATAAHAAFREAVENPQPDILKKRLLTEAGYIGASSGAPDSNGQNSQIDSSELNRIWTDKRTQVAASLKTNGKLEKWHNHFLTEKSKEPGYNSWLQKIYLPLYSGELFEEFLSTPYKTTLFHTIIMTITLLIVVGGIARGIEKFTRLFMPVLLALMAILVVNSLKLDSEQEGVKFLLFGQPEKLHAFSLLEALGHAFFTLSLGMGAMMTYGSYMKKSADIVGNSIWVTAMDTGVALLACLMIFPIIFVYNLEPTSGGIGILFTTLPLEFFKFKWGSIVSILFYLLVLLAAITSAISLLEVVVTFFVDEKKMSRKKAVAISASLIFAAGLPSAFSVNFLTWADNTASWIMLPLGGLLITIFTGYKMDLNLIHQEFKKHGYSDKIFLFFKVSVRYITPALVLFIVAKIVIDFTAS